MIESSDQRDMVEYYLEKCGGDLALALGMATKDVVLFTRTIEDLEHRAKLDAATIEWQGQNLEAAEPGFLTKLADSTVFKVVLFVGGVYLGREMVKVR